MEQLSEPEVIPLLDERARVEKRVVERSHDHLKISTRDYTVKLSDELRSESYTIERRPIGDFVDVAPEVRVEGDTTIYPVFEEVMVKRLVLREEIRVTPRRTSTPYRETVTLRQQVAAVEGEPSTVAEPSTHNPKP